MQRYGLGGIWANETRPILSSFQISPHLSCIEIWNFSTPYLVFVIFFTLTHFEAWKWANSQQERKSPLLSTGEMLGACEEIQNFSTSVMCVMWRNLKFLHICHLFCVVFYYQIYSVLLLNPFCQDLRAFAWRQIEPANSVCGEKLQIWGLILRWWHHLSLTAALTGSSREE